MGELEGPARPEISNVSKLGPRHVPMRLDEVCVVLAGVTRIRRRGEDVVRCWVSRWRHSGAE